MGKTVHGMHKSSEYRTWQQMRHRCSNSNHPQFKDYGGRGIGVCARWDQFENFYADMGPRPAGMTLERDDNDRGYEPGNCRWASRLEQAQNRRSSTLIAHAGETLSAAAWARRAGIPKTTFLARRRNGWDMPTILSTPPSKHNSVARKRQVT